MKPFIEFLDVPIPSFAGREELVSPKAGASTPDLLHATPSQHFNNGAGLASDVDGSSSSRQSTEDEGHLVSVPDQPHLNPNQKIITYKATPTLTEFHDSNEFIRCVLGPVGSGKSSAMVIEILRKAHQQSPSQDNIRRTRWAVIRNTYPELMSTTVKTFADWVPEDLWPVRKISPPTMLIQQVLEDDTEIHCEILFLALDVPSDSRKLLSLELTGAWVNEAREVSEDIFNLLQTRVGRYPSKRLGGPDWYGIIMDSNPPSIDSWIAETFIDPPVGCRLWKQPSGRSKEAENLENLPDGYYDKIAIGKKQSWITSYVDGNFSPVFSGHGIWSEWFDTEKHVLKKHPEVPRGSKLTIGMDFGLTPAAIVGYPLPNGRLLIVGEMISVRSGTLQFGQELKRWLSSEFPNCEYTISGDPAGGTSSETDMRTPYDILSALGISADPAHTNDVEIRIESVTLMLTHLISGHPWLMVSPRCKVLISCLAGGYQYRRLQVSGDARYTEKPDKNKYSHPADALQYLALEFKPQDYANALLKAEKHGFQLDLGQIVTNPISQLLSPKSHAHPLTRDVKCVTRTMRNRNQPRPRR